jgi:hypothetical protein
MANICAPFLPQGINAACLQDMKEIKGILITSYSATFTSRTNAEALSAWKTKIQTDLSVFVPLGINDYDVTTDDPNIVTHNSTRKAIGNQPIPSAKFYLAGNFCDYKDMLAAFNGGPYRMFFVDANGGIYGTATATGVVKGFACNVHAITKGLPLKEIGQNFPLFVNFLSYEEFKSAVLVSPAWNVMIELTEAMPVGYTIFAQSTYSTSTSKITVKITQRCGSGVTGLLAADFEVVQSNDLTSPAVTAVTDSGNGLYDLTVQKAVSPVALAVGDYVIIRVKKVTSTVVNYISNRLTVQP